jgi:hypothetical protein
MRSSAVTSLPYQCASVAGRFGKVFRPAASQNGSPAPTASSPWPPRGSSSPASVSLPPRACKRSCLGRSVAPSPRPPCQAPASFCVDAIGEDLLTDWPPQTCHRPRHDGHPACEPPRLVAPVASWPQRARPTCCYGWGPLQASFACELGCEANFWPMTQMENVNPLFFSEINLKLIQTSKIHIKFNSCLKIMKSILLFF